jgi:hypothetical protein
MSVLGLPKKIIYCTKQVDLIRLMQILKSKIFILALLCTVNSPFLKYVAVFVGCHKIDKYSRWPENTSERITTPIEPT